MAEWTGLEPATPGVTGRYSNQLSYTRSPLGGGEIRASHFRVKRKYQILALNSVCHFQAQFHR